MILKQQFFFVFLSPDFCLITVTNHSYSILRYRTRITVCYGDIGMINCYYKSWYRRFILSVLIGAVVKALENPIHQGFYRQCSGKLFKLVFCSPLSLYVFTALLLILEKNLNKKKANFYKRYC